MRPLLATVFAAFRCASPADAAVNVVTTTEDLASIVREVAGSQFKVRALLRGDKDPIAPPRPTADMPEALRKADLLIAVGSGLEDRWLPSSVGGVKAASDYVARFDEIVARLVVALR